MTWIAFIRHGRTTWNQDGRIQGRTDTNLSSTGRDEIRDWKITEILRRANWVSSPLQRAIETARLLGFEPEIHHPLIEADWGEFEGLNRVKLHQRIDELDLDPSLGIDFQPPGGESPRMVAARLDLWLKSWGGHNQPLVAVTHKGVIRAAVNLATGWDMRRDYAEKLRWNCAHLFTIDADGNLSLKRLNQPLSAKSGPSDETIQD